MICGSILVRMRNDSDKSCTENENTYVTFNNFFKKLCCLWENMEKSSRASSATDDNIMQHKEDALCMPDN